MMNDKLLKQYYTALKPIAERYGFIKYNETYYRVINDIKQSFSIEKTNESLKIKSYRVRFGIISLAQRISSISYHEDFYLKMLLKDFKPSDKDIALDYNAWQYFCGDDPQIIVNEIVQCISDSLFPIFLNCETADTAFIELDKLRIIEEEYRKRLLTVYNIPDCNPSNKNEYTLERLYLALKSKNYDYAYRYYNELLRSYQKSYENVKKCIQKENISDWEIERLRKKLDDIPNKCDQIMEYIKHLQYRNYDFFEKMIDENEKYSR